MLTPPDPTKIQQLVDLLRGDPSVLFITGAGISADSGLPTYRGVSGLYEQADTDDGVPIEVALSGLMFRRRPEVTWRHIRAIEEACRDAQPNRAHAVITALQSRLARVRVVTQNVDGLHGDAGTRGVIEMHGTVRRLLCTRCAWRETVSDYRELPPLPRCPSCEAVIRPAVVLFGEMLPVAASRSLEGELARGFDVIVSVGTTSVFPYIAQPMLEAASRGAVAVEINPAETEVSHAASLRLRCGAAAALGAVGDALGL